MRVATRCVPHEQVLSIGFHLRTLSTPSGERQYILYIPKGYDGREPVPAVLFLHDSGERGEDEIRSAQVGLGAAIAQNPDAFPALGDLPAGPPDLGGRLRRPGRRAGRARGRL